jgi:hypothetical protein
LDAQRRCRIYGWFAFSKLIPSGDVECPLQTSRRLFRMAENSIAAEAFNGSVL